MPLKQTTITQIDVGALAAALASEIAALIAAEVADRLRGVVALGDDAILGEEAAAAALNKSQATMEVWRSKGTGPPSLKLGPRAVGYRVGDLREYVRAPRPLTGALSPPIAAASAIRRASRPPTRGHEKPDRNRRSGRGMMISDDDKTEVTSLGGHPERAQRRDDDPNARSG